MKSKDIKNWRYELSLKEMSELEDFDDLLTEAIVNDCCLSCGGVKVLHDGLCLECSMENIGEDRILSNWLNKNVKVDIKVTIPTH